MAIDVSSINAIQGLLLGNISQTFSLLTVYAKHLLYYFIAFEIIFAGLLWMLSSYPSGERLFFQTLKIGLILFFIQNYISILNSLLASSLIIGQNLAKTNVQEVLLNPGIIWQYGYNFAVTLLQNAATAEGFGFPMILMLLGFGILLTLGLFGIQILIQVVGFYLVAAFSLLLLPLSVFSPLRDFFSRSLRSLLQAAIRLIVQLLLVSAALTLFAPIRLQSFTSGMTINLPLGLLFLGMLFVFASAYLPRLAEKLVGIVHWQSITPITPFSLQTFTPSSASTALTPSVNTTAHAAQLTPSAEINLKSALSSSMPPAISSHYLQAVKEDFLAKQKNKGTWIPDFKLKEQLEEKKRLEDIKKIKQAFYEILKTLQ